MGLVNGKARWKLRAVRSRELLLFISIKEYKEPWWFREKPEEHFVFCNWEYSGSKFCFQTYKRQELWPGHLSTYCLTSKFSCMLRVLSECVLHWHLDSKPWETGLSRWLFSSSFMYSFGNPSLTFLLAMLRMSWRPPGGSQWWCHIPIWWLRRTALWLQHSARFWDPHANAWSSPKILPVVRLRFFSRSSSRHGCHWPPGRQRSLWSFYSVVGGKTASWPQTFNTALNKLGGNGGGGREGPKTRGCST